MADPWLDPVLFSYAVSGGLGVALAVLGFLCIRHERTLSWRTHVVLGGLTTLGAVFGWTAFAADQPLALFLCPQLLLLEYLVVLVVPDPRSHEWLASVRALLRSRSAGFAAFVALLVACPTMGILLAFRSLPPEGSLPPDDLAAIAKEHIQENHKDYASVEPSPASTDLGRPIRISKRVAGQKPLLNVASLEAQQAILDRFGIDTQVIPVVQGWQPCNCHGWVFTDGRFWVHGEDVATILKDNGYYPVGNSPMPGDLAVYHDDAGKITHTGIVRIVTSGLILVESKWGKLGRFIHPHNVHGYLRDECTFYRSARHGHVLQGIPRGSAPEFSDPQVVEKLYSTPGGATSGL